VINPPAKNKRYYFENNQIEPTAEEWLAGATEHKGSWWPNYTEWLAQFGGKKIAAKKALGNTKYKSLVAAPGKYAKEKIGPAA
jgi:polyhydroxyalkanoate synthase subunit PhaC